MARHHNLLDKFPRRQDAGHRTTTRRFLSLFVLTAFSVVHWQAPIASAARKKPKETPSSVARTPERKPDSAFAALPGPVVDLRAAILDAVHSGQIGELRTALDWNELKPDLGAEPGDDPIAHLKKLSTDGEGREVLAAVATLLSMEPAKAALGKNPENSAVYIWPYLAERELKKLSPREEVDLYRLMPVTDAKAMRAGEKWTWWRLAISADGIWLELKKGK